MATGIRDEIERERHRAEEASLSVVVGHLERIEAKIDDAQTSRATNEAAHVERMDRMDARLFAIERHLGLDGGPGPEQGRPVSQRSTPAQVVNGLTLTWWRLVTAVMALMLMSMMGTLVTIGAWSPADVRAVLPW